MKKVLIIQDRILHYRKPFYNELSKYYDVTVLHPGVKTVTSEDLYREIITKAFKLGPFYIQSKVFSTIKKGNYDIIVMIHDLRWLMNFLAKMRYARAFPFVWWGMDFSKSPAVNYVKRLSVKGKTPIVYYCEKLKNDFAEQGVNRRKLFFANNTFAISEQDREKCFLNQGKNIILFVGSMDKRKQSEVLLQAFANIIKDIPENIKLYFVGEGEQKSSLEKLVEQLKLEQRVVFKGKIIDNKTLKFYYKEALFSVSFGQAGLSVLQSLGYGVPFVTKKNAVTGGELFNIVDGENGILCEDDIISLQKTMKKLCNDKPLCLELGKRAYDYYDQYCTMENMVSGFIRAFDYAEDAFKGKSFLK